jgi:hypothetical protein
MIMLKGKHFLVAEDIKIMHENYISDEDFKKYFCSARCVGNIKN